MSRKVLTRWRFGLVWEPNMALSSKHHFELVWFPYLGLHPKKIVQRNPAPCQEQRVEKRLE